MTNYNEIAQNNLDSLMREIAAKYTKTTNTRRFLFV